jgi:hypothetical protein
MISSHWLIDYLFSILLASSGQSYDSVCATLPSTIFSIISIVGLFAVIYAYKLDSETSTSKRFSKSKKSEDIENGKGSKASNLIN